MPDHFDEEKKHWPDERLYLALGVVFIVGLALAILVGWLVR